MVAGGMILVADLAIGLDGAAHVPGLVAGDWQEASRVVVRARTQVEPFTDYFGRVEAGGVRASAALRAVVRVERSVVPP